MINHDRSAVGLNVCGKLMNGVPTFLNIGMYMAPVNIAMAIGTAMSATIFLANPGPIWYDLALYSMYASIAHPNANSTVSNAFSIVSFINMFTISLNADTVYITEIIMANISSVNRVTTLMSKDALNIPINMCIIPLNMHITLINGKNSRLKNDDTLYTADENRMTGPVTPMTIIPFPPNNANMTPPNADEKRISIIPSFPCVSLSISTANESTGVMDAKNKSSTDDIVFGCIPSM
mmetsp:Transcript_10304/g.15066  ORF Transcript_10304/g.15066 Transcript_10304/m.15066 type:complete len:236 (-) Transcript_10304:174-881(-)